MTSIGRCRLIVAAAAAGAAITSPAIVRAQAKFKIKFSSTAEPIGSLSRSRDLYALALTARRFFAAG
jgi:hypothetical protein